MSDLMELYQEVIVDHSKRPRNFGELDPCSHSAEGFNPLCGDQLTVYLQIEDGVIRDIRFAGEGCAISTSSASLMTQSIKGKALADVPTLFKSVHGLMTGKGDGGADLGKLAVFAGVQAFPMRVKCATLAWHTLNAAIDGRDAPISTE